MAIDQYKRLTDIPGVGPGTVAVFVRDGLYLDVNGGCGTSGHWRIDSNRKLDTLVVYNRVGAINEVGKAEVVRVIPSPKSKGYKTRRMVCFKNFQLVGFTDSNWKEFAETGNNPVRYL